MKYTIGICPKCGRRTTLTFSNNPLITSTICFSCLKEDLDHQNLEHGEFYCRTYNLPWIPELWMTLDKDYGDDVFQQYTTTILDDPTYQPNLAYDSSTKDLWLHMNKEWEKCRSFEQVMNKLDTIRDSYTERGHLKWGEQYDFSQLLKLDSIYSRTLKANNITNPLQKEAVKMLCKLQIELDEAILVKDMKAVKDISNAWSTFSKQADLETMINDTKTDDITTVSELYDFMEKEGFKFKFYDGFPKDEVDTAINDIQNTNKRLILESTGLQQLLEDMMRQRMESAEQQYTTEVTDKENLQDLLNFKTEDGEIATESDEEAQNLNFSEDDDYGTSSN